MLCAMHAAGWQPADPVTLRSSVKIIGSVVLDRPYLEAPVSPLFYENRRQDLAFEKPSGRSARDAPPRSLLEGARRRRGRLPGLARRGRFRRRPRRQPLHRPDHPPHRAGHRRGAGSADVRSVPGEQGRGHLFGERRRTDVLCPQRRRRSLFHRWRDRGFEARFRLLCRGRRAAAPCPRRPRLRRKTQSSPG